MFDPESLEITREILNMVAEIDEFKGAWQAMAKIAPERLSQLKKSCNHRKYWVFNKN